jgi:hypothetical protein
MTNQMVTASLGALLATFAAGDVAAQSQRFERSVIMAPPIAQQPPGQPAAPPSKIDALRQPADDLFGPEARLNLRLSQLEKRLDQIIKQNIVLKQQLDLTTSELAELENRMKQHSSSTSFGTNGMSLINMVQQIWAKVNED